MIHIHIISSVLIISFVGLAGLLAFGLLMEFCPVATVAAGLVWLWIAKKKETKK